MADVVRAHAKLTLSLRVTGVRDDGYHLLDAEMITLDLADTLEFSDGDGLEILYTEGSPERDVPTGGDNLVLRALAVAGRQARVRLTKRIP
ncbi:MAG TPA: 4-(cytidine 5'-diphospho)-2-C-methyl-D-erythritol kinase, partial [Acidimicrobiales bacterium]|nr:4-(cytidine 5'-diphospho)-2-C-methyl-D-erythritol kinase [Acidimicrobiales bacterium]